MRQSKEIISHSKETETENTSEYKETNKNTYDENIKEDET